MVGVASQSHRFVITFAIFHIWQDLGQGLVGKPDELAKGFSQHSFDNGWLDILLCQPMFCFVVILEDSQGISKPLQPFEVLAVPLPLKVELGVFVRAT